MLMRKTSLQKYWPLYLLTTAVAFILRYFSKATDSDVINWMLAPTVRWVSILSGITFQWERLVKVQRMFLRHRAGTIVYR